MKIEINEKELSQLIYTINWQREEKKARTSTMKEISTQEAIAIIEADAINLHGWLGTKDLTDKQKAAMERKLAAIDIAQEAMRKQTPTKPNWVYEDEPLCPYCGEVLDDSDPLCENCHQILDWKED